MISQTLHDYEVGTVMEENDNDKNTKILSKWMKQWFHLELN